MVQAFSTQEGNNGNDNKKVTIVCKHCKSKNFTKEGYRKTGAVPCELANLKMDLGQNRWLGLIKLASQN